MQFIQIYQHRKKPSKTAERWWLPAFEDVVRLFVVRLFFHFLIIKIILFDKSPQIQRMKRGFHNSVPSCEYNIMHNPRQKVGQLILHFFQ